MLTYYTERGDVIYNPTAYAKTGAPMYKTKYGNTTNINQETDIYKLKLENGKKYIGKTTNIERRLNEHFTGNGSQVTKKFAPHKAQVIETIPGYFANIAEQEHTNDNINKYGYDNVRGGKYTNSKTLKYNNKSNSKSTNNCFRCGRKGHYSVSCYANTDVYGNYLSESDDDY